MGAHAHVQNGNVHFVVNNVCDVGDELAGLPANGFAWFHDDLQVWVAIVEIVQQAHEVFPVVVLAGYVVSASKVDPLHAVKVLAKVLFESGKYAFQCVDVLLAQRMEVQTLNAVQQFGFELVFGDAQAAELAAGVVKVGLHCGILRVDADAATHVSLEGAFLEPAPLAKAVERDVVGEGQNLVNLSVLVGRCKYVNFFPHFFFGESCLVQTAGRGSREVFCDNGETSPKTVAFEGANYFDTGLFLYFRQDIHVPAKAIFVQNIAGSFDF